MIQALTLDGKYILIPANEKKEYFSKERNCFMLKWNNRIFEWHHNMPMETT